MDDCPRRLLEICEDFVREDGRVKDLELDARLDGREVPLLMFSTGVVPLDRAGLSPFAASKSRSEQTGNLRCFFAGRESILVKKGADQDHGMGAGRKKEEGRSPATKTITDHGPSFDKQYGNLQKYQISTRFIHTK